MYEIEQMLSGKTDTHMFSVSNVVPEGIRVSAAVEETTMDRVDKAELRACYLKDPIVFKAVTTYENLLPRYTFRYTDKKTERFFTEWLEHSGFDWEFKEAIKNICIYGDAWLELIKDSKGNIVDIANINPEQFNYKRIGDRIELDERTGLPKGYEQKLPYPVGGKTKIEFDYDDILHLTFFTVGSGYYGVGIVEPVYYPTVWKLNILEGYAEAVQQVGFPIKVMYVGDPSHPVAKEELRGGLAALKKVNRTKSIALPYWMKIDLLEPRWSLANIREQLELLVDMQIAGLGIPKAFISGIGEGSNRKALVLQNRDYERSLNGIRQKLAQQVEEGLFKRVAEQHGLNSYPKFDWQPIGLKDMEDLAKRLESYTKAGVLKPDKELEKEIRKWEGLPGGE